MCLILIAYKSHPRYPLIIAANRDEFYDRPTAPASFWKTEPWILAGKDLKAGGTWLGINRQGRIAALSNFRDPRTIKGNAPSRGGLVTEFLLGKSTPVGYLEEIRKQSRHYNGFSMIFGNMKQVCVYTNKGDTSPFLRPGIHGLSNHFLDTPWPKVARGKAGLEEILSGSSNPPVEEIFSLLADKTMPDDNLLPDTGIGMEWERRLAPLFISGPLYGTRSSTILMIDNDSMVTFMERTHNHHDSAITTFRFTIED